MKGTKLRRTVHTSEGDRHEFGWGSITWLHSAAFSGSGELTLGEVVIRAGQSNPMHTHPNCEEVLYLIEGELLHTCGDEEVSRLTPGSSICIPRGAAHNARCTSECDARMIVAYSSPARKTLSE